MSSNGYSELPAAPVPLSARPIQKGVTHVPLPTELKAIIAGDELTHYQGIMAFFGSIDKFVTPILRWPGLVKELLFESPNANGPVLDFMSGDDPNSLPVRMVFYITVGIAASVNLLYEALLHKEKRKKREDLTQNIRKMLKKGLEEEKEEDTAKRNEKFFKNIEAMNDYLAAVLNESSTLKNKYAKLQLEFPANADELTTDELLDQMQLKFIEKTSPVLAEEAKHTYSNNAATKNIRSENEKSFWQKYMVEILWNKILLPAWEGGTIPAMVFWCSWILVAATTGQLSEGIFGVSNLITFGLPIALSVPYFGIKLYNRIHHGKGKNFKEADDQARSRHEAELDTAEVLERTMNKITYEQDYQRLIMELMRVDKTLSNLPKPAPAIHVKGLNAGYEKPAAKAAVVLILQTITNFGLYHYHLWFMKDFLKLVAGVIILASQATPLGWIGVGVAALFGVIKMVHSYQQAKEQKKVANLQPENTQIVSLEEAKDHYKKQKAYLNELLGKISELKHTYGIALPECLEKKTEPKTWQAKLYAGFMYGMSKIRKSQAIASFDTAMAVSFGARLLWMGGFFIPFVVLGTLMSNPVTFACIIAFTAVLVGLDYYQARQRNKEKQIKEFPQKNEKQESKIEMAELYLLSIEKNVEHEATKTNTNTSVLMPQLDDNQTPQPSNTTSLESAPKMNTGLTFYSRKNARPAPSVLPKVPEYKEEIEPLTNAQWCANRS